MQQLMANLCIRQVPEISKACGFQNRETLRPADAHVHPFIVTNMDMEPYQIIQFYCGRGKMENFIKEGKSGFDFAAVSSHSKIVNANRMRLPHACLQLIQLVQAAGTAS